MNRQKEDRKIIAGMECLNRDKAAEYAGMSLSKLDKTVRLSRAGKAKVRLKFFQLVKGAPIWFPIKYLDEFVNEVIERGCAI